MLKDLIFDKIKSKLALILIFVALFMQKFWLFGILFLIWAILDIKNKQTHLLEPITRESNPILYTVVVLSWLGLAIFSFSGLFYTTIYY